MLMHVFKFTLTKKNDRLVAYNKISDIVYHS